LVKTSAPPPSRLLVVLEAVLVGSVATAKDFVSTICGVAVASSRLFSSKWLLLLSALLVSMVARSDLLPATNASKPFNDAGASRSFAFGASMVMRNLLSSASVSGFSHLVGL